MTPFEIQMLIHYHCTDDPFPHLNSPAGKEAADKLVAAGILYRSTENGALARVPQAMDLYIQALCDIPLPKKVWLMTDNQHKNK